MSTRYQFVDDSGDTRLAGTLLPDPAGGADPIGPAGGDLAGSYPDPTLDLTKAHTWTGNQTAPAIVASGLTGSVAASRYVGGVASVAPTTGAHLVGDFVIAQNGKVFICTAAGTPGAWTQAGATFNGGTITGALTETSPSTADGALFVAPSSTAADQFIFTVVDQGSALAFAVALTHANNAIVQFGNKGVEGRAQFWGDYENDPLPTLEVSSSARLGFHGATPVVQSAAIADAAGGAVQDTQARTALNSLLAAMRAHGLIAT